MNDKNNSSVLLHITKESIQEDRIKCFLAHVNPRNPKDTIAFADIGSSSEFCSGAPTFLNVSKKFRDIIENLVFNEGRNTLYAIIDDDNYQLTKDGTLYITPLSIKGAFKDFQTSYINNEDICIPQTNISSKDNKFYAVLQFFNPNSLEANSFKGGGFNSLEEAIKAAKSLHIEEQYGNGLDIYQYYTLDGNPVQ